MFVKSDKSGANIFSLNRREVYSLRCAITRELNFAKEFNNRIVNKLVDLEMHIEILEKLLRELPSE